MIRIAALALVGSLAACGPLNEGNAAQGLLGVVKERVNALRSDGAAAPAAAPVLTRAQADANPGGYLIVVAYGGASVAAMVPISGVGNRVTWISADSVTVTVEDGIIVSTRGFPRDLIGSELSGVREAIAAGGGTAQRVQEVIDDNDQIQRRLLQCSIALEGSEIVTILDKSTQTRRISEQCTGSNLRITNVYWVSGSGEIVRSTQAVAPETGFLQLDRP